MAQKIYKTEDGQTIIANMMNDVTNVSFKDYILKFHSYSIAPVISNLAFKLFCFLPMDSIARIVSRQSFELAKEQLTNLEKVELPKEIYSLLKSDLKKKEQEKIWKGLSLDINQLGAIFLNGEKLGYKFSSYRFEGTPKKIKKEDLPNFAYVDDNDILHRVGGESLSEGQLRALINESKVIYVQMLDNGIQWHAFIRTFQGLKGKEPGTQGSVPHIHYYSNKNGISKADFVDMIKKGNYPTAKVHIPLIDKQIASH
jgi:hypothetical protein